jgi:hypothetical protein
LFTIADGVSAADAGYVPRLSTDVVLMGGRCRSHHILTPEQALSGFSNSGLITVAGMFVVAAGIRHSGGVDLIVERILGRPAGIAAAPLDGAGSCCQIPQQHAEVATMIPAVSYGRGAPPAKLRLMIPQPCPIRGTMT